ncbi:MAG TPA: DUF6458 family protein [Solirubrobacteraceae bacterium]
MGIGASIFLIAVGAILTFALNVSIGALDLDVVGWILMAAGVLGLVLTAIVWGPRRRAVVTRRSADYVDRPADYTVEERTDAGPPDTYR